jgi:hypothetical protein
MQGGVSGLFTEAGPQRPLNLPWNLVHGYGLAALRPPASPKLLYFFYYSSDTTTLAQCQRSGSGYAWVSVGGGAGTVTSVGSGYGLSGGPITTTGTLVVALTGPHAALSADVTIVNANTAYDGPSTAFTAGNYLFTAKAIISNGAVPANYTVRIWDGGSNIVDEAEASAFANDILTVTLANMVTLSTGTYKLSVWSTQGASNGTLKKVVPDNSSGIVATVLNGLRFS